MRLPTVSELLVALSFLLPLRRRPAAVAPRRRRAHPSVERLDERVLPSATLLTDPAANLQPDHLTTVGSLLFFVANDGTNGRDLWVSNGTAAGTHPVQKANPVVNPQCLTNVNGLLLFTALDPQNNTISLWKSDGSDSGTTLVLGGLGALGYGKGIDNTDRPFPVLNGYALFNADVNSDPQYVGLWESNGVSSGVVAPNLTADFMGNVVGGRVFFTAWAWALVGSPPRRPQQVNLGYGLYTTDGTITKLVTGSSLFDPRTVGPFSGGFYTLDNTNALFSADNSVGDNGDGPNQLWSSDGTAGGTVPLTNLNVGIVGGNGQLENSFAAVDTAQGPRLFFAGNDTTKGGAQLWASDGTVAGTSVVAELNSVDYPPLNLTAFGQEVFFSDQRPNQITQPWVSDGTANGTVSLGANIGIYPANEYPAVIGNRIYFTAGGPGPALDADLYTSDGTAAGTSIIAQPDGQGPDAPAYLTAVGGNLFFSAENPPGYTSDGIRGLWVYPTQATTTTHVSASPASSTYGQAVTLTATVAAPAGSGTPAGNIDFVDTTTNTDLGTVSLSGTTAQLTVSSLAAGTHAITATYGGGSNFLGSSGSLTLTVSPADQTITFGPLAKQTYGAAPFPLGATASSGLAVSFSIVSGPATISGNTLTVTGVGTVVVEASQAGNANYNPAAAVDQSFTVAPAVLTVTANDTSRVYGSANPTFTATITGFVNGDTASVVSGSASLTTAATASSVAGRYAIAGSQGTLTAANYTFAFVAGTLTVTALDVSGQMSWTHNTGGKQHLANGTTQWVQSFSVSNTGQTALQGSLVLELNNLAPGTTFLGATINGAFVAAKEDPATGYYYIDLVGALNALGAGQTLTFTLDFNQAPGVYTPRFLQGLS